MGKNKKFKTRKKVRSLAEIQLEKIEGKNNSTTNGFVVNKNKDFKFIESEKYKRYKAKVEKYAEELKKGTIAELKLKAAFDADRISYSFQKPFYSTDRCYIVDFYFINTDGKRYVIELDGSSHNDKQVYDLERSLFLAKNHNCKIIRFKNYEIHNHLHEVLNEIYRLKPRRKDSVKKEIHNSDAIKIKAKPEFKDLEGVEKHITHEGQPCRKCLTPVIKRIPSQVENPKQKFRYKYYFYCKKCKTMYMPKDAIEWIVK